MMQKYWNLTNIVGAGIVDSVSFFFFASRFALGSDRVVHFVTFFYTALLQNTIHTQTQTTDEEDSANRFGFQLNASSSPIVFYRLRDRFLLYHVDGMIVFPLVFFLCVTAS